jgi:hypothetical protein
MQETAQLVSKVLVLNDMPRCGAHQGLLRGSSFDPGESRKPENLSVLKSNVDLGAIFLSGGPTWDKRVAGLELALAIHADPARAAHLSEA